jgi:hypothetical protein
MTTFISKAFSDLLSFLTTSRLNVFSIKRFAALLLVGVLTFGFSIQAAHADESLGERFRDRIENFDRSTERPKTTGQFKDEVRGDVPLSERIDNTVRDSAEAFKQFGKEYAVGAQESADNVKDKAAEAGEKVSDSVR